MFGYSWGPILIILLIVLILFGPRRLPELGDSIGKAIRSFKKAHDEPQQENVPPKEVTGGTGAAGAAPQAATCPQCHKDLTGDFAFCPHCGSKVKAA
jgi:sec-independent protein translocase protein TatA